MPQAVGPPFSEIACLVLGMHRSGTSAVSGALGRLGFRHPGRMLAPNDYNSKGFWEPQDVVALNDRALKTFDRHWSDPKPMPADWRNHPLRSNFQSEANRLLADELGPAGGTVIKDPRITRLLPIWRDALAAAGTEPVCLIACRHPMEVAESLRIRDNMTLDHGLLLWFTYMIEAEYSTRGLRRSVIGYDELLANPTRALERAFERCELDAGAVLETQAVGVGEFLDRRLRHQVFEGRAAGADPATNGLAGGPASGPAGGPVSDLFALLTQGVPDDRRNEFDRLRRSWQAEWSDRSPGPGASNYPGTLGVWHMEQGRDAAARGDTGTAIGEARRAVALHPAYKPFRTDLARYLVDAGCLEEAETVLHEIVSLDDADGHAYASLADVLSRRGRPDQAMDALRRAVDLEPGIAAYHFRLGNTLARAERPADAETAYRRAIALDGEASRFHAGLARVLHRQGRTDAAIAAISKAREHEPENPRYCHLLGNFLIRADRLAEAEIMHRRAVALDGDRAGFAGALANVLVLQGRLEEALREFERASLLDPESAGYRKRIANLRARPGRGG